MRNLVLAAATTLTLVGCLSQSAYEEKFVEKYCEEWKACNTATPDDCPMEGSGTGTTTAEAEDNCDYDSGAAKDCLNGEWTCNDEFEGFEVPVPPAVCADVCGDVSGDTDGGGDSDTDAS